MSEREEERAVKLAERFFGEEGGTLARFAMDRFGGKGLLSVNAALASWNSCRLNQDTSARSRATWERVRVGAGLPTSGYLPL